MSSPLFFGAHSVGEDIFVNEPLRLFFMQLLSACGIFQIFSSEAFTFLGAM